MDRNSSAPIVGFFLLLIFYKLILDISYIDFVSVRYAYSGFHYVSNLVKISESWVAYFFLSFLIPRKFQKPSDFLIFIFFIFTITPMLCYYGLANRDRLYTYFVILVFLIVNIVLMAPRLRVSYIKNGRLLALYIAIFFIFITFVKFIVSRAIFQIDFDFSKVYDRRRELNELLFSGVWGYIIPWTSKVLMIFIISVALLNRKYLLALVVILLQICIFGITSHKAIAFYPLFVLAIYLFRNTKYFIIYFLLVLNCFLSLCYLAFYFYEDIWFPAIVTRIFFLPALINFSYYDYFSTHGYVFLSHSILSSFIDYPYRLQPENLIGSEFFGDPKSHANTGFIATSFMNFGFAGMIFFAFILGLLMKLVDSFSESKNPAWFFLAIVIIPFFSIFFSTAFLTAMLTNGLGLAILLCWFSYEKAEDTI